MSGLVKYCDYPNGSVLVLV